MIFLDIHLEDTNSFEIFKRIKVDCPIIFTTAYNEYAIQAFKVNSIDYLLKPIDLEELKISITKYHNLYTTTTLEPAILAKSIPYKERFLIKKSNQFISILSSGISYFVSQNKLTYINTIDG